MTSCKRTRTHFALVKRISDFRLSPFWNMRVQIKCKSLCATPAAAAVQRIRLNTKSLYSHSTRHSFPRFLVVWSERTRPLNQPPLLPRVLSRASAIAIRAAIFIPRALQHRLDLRGRFASRRLHKWKSLRCKSSAPPWLYIS